MTESPRKPQGFTFLELIVTMAIVALILGLGAVSFANLFRQQDLEEPGAELKRMARQAAALATSRNRKQVIQFEESGISLFRRPEGNRIDQIVLPSGGRWLLKPWGGERWLPLKEYDWGFDANGLCEPIRVRFERGESFYEIDFHPLGGGVRDERLVIAGQEP